MNCENLHKDLLVKIDDYLRVTFDRTVVAQLLLDAMRYSCLNGGKRIRPLLTVAVGMMYNVNLEVLIRVGSAIELIHCYSLIHDDLPAMDNDDLRRGLPTCHKKFNEATAILAGDALQSMAFELLSGKDLNLDPQAKLDVVNLLAYSSGVEGMVGGQVMDLLNTGKKIVVADLQQMHRLKTGALIKSSVLAGYLCSNSFSQSVYDELSLISGQLGLLFQVVDDIIDETGSTDTLGKTAHKDQSTNKATYVTILGLDVARDFAHAVYSDIIERLKKHSGADFLLYLANLVYSRNN